MSERSQWLLCTRTLSVDYFWINARCQKVAKTPGLYRRVAYEGTERTGYLLVDDGIVEACVSNLDAQREDRLGRHIRHVLIVRADAKDGDGVDFVRNMFAEAISTESTNDSASVLARRLYDHWKDRDKDGECGDYDWRACADDLRPSAPPSAMRLEFGRQYRRDREILESFAATAVEYRGEMLLLCAASNAPNRIWPIPEYKHIPAALCALDVIDHDETSPNHSGRRDLPGGNNVARRSQKLGLLFGVIIFAVILLAYAMFRRPTPADLESHSGSTAADTSSEDTEHLVGLDDSISVGAKNKENTAQGVGP